MARLTMQRLSQRPVQAEKTTMAPNSPLLLSLETHLSHSSPRLLTRPCQVDRRHLVEAALQRLLRLYQLSPVKRGLKAGGISHQVQFWINHPPAFQVDQMFLSQAEEKDIQHPEWRTGEVIV